MLADPRVSVEEKRDLIDFLFNAPEEEVDEMTVGPADSQLSATLYSLLIGPTTKESFRRVEMTGGHGREAWRQLDRRYGPQTDAKLLALTLSLANFKFKG